MTATSPATSIADTEAEEKAKVKAKVKAETKARRKELLKIDLERAFKECGPRLFTPNPTYGTRIFVIASKDAILDNGMCTKLGVVHRSALVEAITETELDELITDLRADGYDVKKESVVNDPRGGSYVSFRSIYYAGNTK